MAQTYFNFIRVRILPVDPQPNTFYYLKNGAKAEAYMTGADAVLVPVTNTEAIMALIDDISFDSYDPGDLVVDFNNALAGP